MKVRVTVPRTEEIEVDVTFPIYRKHDLLPDDHECIIYYRHAVDGTLVSVQEWERDGTRKYEIEIGHANLNCGGSPSAYILGQGQYKSSKEEFDAVLQRMKDVLESVS